MTLVDKILGRRGEWDWISPYTGVWLMPESMARLMMRRIGEYQRAYSPKDLFELQKLTASANPTAIEDGVPHFVSIDKGLGILSISGALSKRRLLSGPPTYAEYAAALDLLGERDDVATAVLKVDSPGGSIAGLDETAAALRRLKAKKRVVAHADDCTCSAAYWLASQAHEITANPTASVGAIGIYAVLIDRSQQAKDLGIEVVVVRSAEMKGIGVPGTKITETLRKEVQREIDTTAELFLQNIAAGRGVSIDEAREWHDGRSHIGQAAVDIGLADRVTSFHDLVAELSSSDASASVLTPTPETEDSMSAENDTPATTAESPRGDDSAPTASAEERNLLAGLRRLFGGGTTTPNPNPVTQRLEQLDQRNAEIDQRLAALDVREALQPLQGKLPPAVFKAGLADLALELRGQGKLDQLTQVLAAIPDVQLDATELAAPAVAGQVGTLPLAQHEKQVLDAAGIDDAQLTKIAAKFPDAIRDLVN